MSDTEDASELEILKAMPDRGKLFLAKQALKAEEQWLAYMVECNKEDDAIIEQFVQSARNCVEEDEDTAETYMQLAKEIKASRYPIADIRKQRERIQCHRKRVTKLSTSSSN